MFEIELFICIKNDLALSNLDKTQTNNDDNDDDDEGKKK